MDDSMMIDEGEQVDEQRSAATREFFHIFKRNIMKRKILILHWTGVTPNCDNRRTQESHRLPIYVKDYEPFNFWFFHFTSMQNIKKQFGLIKFI